MTHAYYTENLAAFEKLDQLPGFRTSYDLLFDAEGADGEAYSYADRYPSVVAEMRRELTRARTEFELLRVHGNDVTYPK